MGRSPRHEERGLKKGPWTPQEDQKLVLHIEEHGHGSWRALPKLAGLNRCGKSCRLRWTNYLRPDIKRGKFSEEEEQTILHLHSVLGNKWSSIASHLPGRTDNEIKNFWNTHLKKKLIQMGFDPMTHQPRTDHFYSSLPHLIALANLKALIDYHQLSKNLSYDGLTFPSVTDHLHQIDTDNSNHINQMVNDLLILSGSGDASEVIEAPSYDEPSILTSSLDFYYSQPLCHQMPFITSFDNDDTREAHHSNCQDYYGGGGGEGGDNHHMERRGQMIVAEEPCVDFNYENHSQGFLPELLSCESSSMHRFS